ncbi:phage portal protein [Saccharopolyspora shandongensis]|uniref:phage portal protein n=1 Tax=Saccharopolyspora shandongensis TaxID=418495 RepID=UPI003423AFD1
MTSWPPPPFDVAAARMREHDAWYVGDPDRLARLYSSAPAARTRPSQYRGGLVGAVSRFFWGRPIPADQRRTRLHVPLAADIATASADLLFSEPPRITVDNPRAQARLDDILNIPEVHSGLLEGAEVAAALGGVYLRVVWDAEFEGHAMLDTVDADAAVPEWRWKRLAAVTFWEVLDADGPGVLRHLERHEPGRILHSLHRGTDTELGAPVPLDEHPSTVWAAPLVDADGAISTGTQRLTAAYVPNIRPNRHWRGTPDLAPLGRSDFDGVEPLLDALDETYSSWMRDIRLAKARLLVPVGYLQPQGPGQGATFDDDQEVFTELNMLTRGDASTPITATQFAIRVAEHRETADEIVRAILRTAGYSPATFGDHDGEAPVTATEVTARERRSEHTRGKKARYWAAGLSQITGALLDVDRHAFGTGVSVTAPPTVEFTSRAQPDPEALARTAQLLFAAEAASTEVRVRLVHPDWDDDQVDAEVQRILDETGRNVPDPASFRGFDEQTGGARDGMEPTRRQ